MYDKKYNQLIKNIKKEENLCFCAKYQIEEIANRIYVLYSCPFGISKPKNKNKKFILYEIEDFSSLNFNKKIEKPLLTPKQEPELVKNDLELKLKYYNPDINNYDFLTITTQFPKKQNYPDDENWSPFEDIGYTDYSKKNSKSF